VLISEAKKVVRCHNVYRLNTASETAFTYL